MHGVVDDNSNPYKNMVMDVMILNQGCAYECSSIDKEPNIDASRFFDILKDSYEPLWDECTNHNKLLVIAHVLTIKSNHGLIEAGYDIIVK